MIELFLLPPLEGLPSLCGSCVAALCLCELSLEEGQFVVVHSTDLSLIPALRVNGKFHHGYANIKSYLATVNDIDAHLTLDQKADVTAWGSLLEDLGDTLSVPSRP